MPPIPRALRLVVVGGGHASLPLLAHAREHEGVEVTLLSDHPALWYSGMTPEWTGGVYTLQDVTVDLTVLCRRAGVRFVQGRAAALDRAARTVTTEAGETVAYDLLAVDVGSVNPHAAAAGPAVPTKPLHRIDALSDVLRAAARGARRRLAVVGGGAAGVETALNVTARPDLRDTLSLTLLEPGDRILASMPPSAGAWAAATLRERGAEVRTRARAAGVDEAGVHLDTGETVPADAVLWATGSTGQPFLRESGLPTTDDGFVRVAPSLRAVGDPRVFVAGDAAAVEGHEGLARIGVHAVKQGPVLRENVGRALAALRRGAEPDRIPLRPFRPYPVAPLILSTGGRTGLFTVGPVAVRGRWALALKHAVDRRWIARYRTGERTSYGGRWDLRAACGTPRPLDAG